MVQTTKRAAFAAALAALVGTGAWYWLRADEDAVPAPDAGQARSLAEGDAAAAPSLLSLQTPLPPRGALSIRGLVRGADGPVADATVYAFPSAPGQFADGLRCDCPEHCRPGELRAPQWESCPALGEALLDRAEEAQGLRPLARATTAADGSFELSGFEPGHFTLWAERGSRLGLRLDVWAGASDTDLELDEGRALQGKAVDERGAGLAGLEVWAVEPEHGRYFRTVTRDAGRFAFDALPRGTYLLAARRDGLLAATTQALEQMTEEAELRLVAPRAIAGKVLRRDAPAAGVPVVLDGPHGAQSTRSDPDGAFRFEGLAPGAYAVAADEGPLAARAPVALEAGEDVRDVLLTLVPAARVRGVVRSAAGPLAQASVTVLVGDRPRQTVRADPAGRFELQLFEAGTYGFLVQAPAHQPRRLERTLSSLAPLELDVQLEAATRVQGTVVDASGHPLREASVECRPVELEAADEEGPPSLLSPTARSTADGRFELEVAAAGDCDLGVDHPGFRPFSQRVRAPAEGLRVTLQRGLTLRGVVLDEAEAPVVEATVEAGPVPGGEGPGEPRPLRQARTNSRGEFELQGLEPGAHRVLALSGHDAFRTGGPLQTLRTATAVVEVTPDGSPVTLRFAAGLPLAGQVVDQHGRPVVDALVSAVPELEERGEELAERDVERLLERASMGSAKTGPEGRFRIDNLKPGDYRVRASRRGFQRSTEATVARAGQEQVRLELTARGQIRGRVAHADGSPVPEFQVNRRPVQHDGGEFELSVEQTGEQPLVIEARGHATVFRTVRTTLGEDLDVGTIGLEDGREVRGQVREAGSDLPVAGAVVRLAPPGTRAGLLRPPTTASVTTGPDGLFVLEHVDGAATVLVAREGYRDGAAELGEQQQSVVIALARGGRIEGLALAADGTPLAGARVIARAAAVRDGAGVAEAGPDGRFEIGGLAGGRYAVRLHLGLHAGLEGGSPVHLAPTEALVPTDGVARVTLRASAQATRLKVRLSPTAPRTHLLLLGPATLPTPTDTDDLTYLSFASDEGEEDGGGTFTFAPVPPGPYALFVIAEDGVTTRLFRQPVAIGADGEQALLVTLPAQLPALRSTRGPTAVASP